MAYVGKESSKKVVDICITIMYYERWNVDADMRIHLSSIRPDIKEIYKGNANIVIKIFAKVFLEITTVKSFDSVGKLTIIINKSHVKINSNL